MNKKILKALLAFSVAGIGIGITAWFKNRKKKMIN